MTGDKSQLRAVSDISPVQVHAAFGNVLHARQTGTVEFERFILDDVYHVPGLQFNLVSIPQLVSKGIIIEFGAITAKLHYQGTLLAEISRGFDKLYRLRSQPSLLSLTMSAT